MSIDQTQAIMHRYFEAMEVAKDFSEFYSNDVTWLTVESCQKVRGRAVVRDYILDLHSRIRSQEQPQGLVVTDGHAYLEGALVNAEPGDPGLSYCLVYDVVGDWITAMRCYGNIASLLTVANGAR